MDPTLSYTALAAGAISGAVVFATILLVPGLRYIVLAGATTSILIVYSQGGVARLVDYTSRTLAAFHRRTSL